MHPADMEQLARWLRIKATPAEVERAQQYGLVENRRFTVNAVRAFKLLWLWSAPRFGGEAGERHDDAYAKLGSRLYSNRIERAKTRINAIIGTHKN